MVTKFKEEEILSMNNKVKKGIIALVSVTTLGVTLGPTAISASAYVQSETDSEKVENITLDEKKTISTYLTEDDKVFMNKLEGIYPYFQLDDNGALFLELDSNQLMSEYNFTSKEVVRLDNIIKDQNIGASYANKYLNENEMAIQPLVHVKNWKIYFEAYEVPMYLGSAISAGAPAVIASIASLGSVVPGIGNIIGLAAGVWAGTEILYHATQALVNKQGFYIGLTFNGVFPNPDIGTW